MQRHCMDVTSNVKINKLSRKLCNCNVTPEIPALDLDKFLAKQFQMKNLHKFEEVTTLLSIDVNKYCPVNGIK